MPKKINTNSFIKNSKTIHGNKYSYSKVNYIKSNVKVIIICSIHGDYSQKPNCHLRGKGCPSCNSKKTLCSKSFIEKSNKIHNKLYSYLNTNYTGSNSNVVITCKKHGDFKQRASNHLQGVGCSKCAVDLHERTGWSHSNWKNAAEKSKNFCSFKVYIIKCWNDVEEFYKIGRTFTTVKQRFNSNFYMPYNYEIVKIFKGTAEDMVMLEKELQRKNKKFKYIPNESFSGIRECFKKVIYDK